jgi:hypothetical protein
MWVAHTHLEQLQLIIYLRQQIPLIFPSPIHRLSSQTPQLALKIRSTSCNYRKRPAQDLKIAGRLDFDFLFKLTATSTFKTACPKCLAAVSLTL